MKILQQEATHEILLTPKDSDKFISYENLYTQINCIIDNNL